jgi:hypothetical protein
VFHSPVKACRPAHFFEALSVYCAQRTIRPSTVEASSTFVAPSVGAARSRLLIRPSRTLAIRHRGTRSPALLAAARVRRAATRRAAEQRDELAPSHGTHPKARITNYYSTVQRSRKRLPKSEMGQKLRLRPRPDRQLISAAPRNRTPMLGRAPASPPRTQARFLPPTPIAAVRIFIAPPPSQRHPSSAAGL